MQFHLFCFLGDGGCRQHHPGVPDLYGDRHHVSNFQTYRLAHTVWHPVQNHVTHGWRVFLHHAIRCT